MASYDSPNFQDRLPGLPPRSSHDYMTAPGTPPAPAGAPSEAQRIPTPGPGQVWITPAGGSTINGDMVNVGPRDTLVSPQAGLYDGNEPNPLSTMPGAQVGQSGAGQGNVVTTPHPNSFGLNPDA